MRHATDVIQAKRARVVAEMPDWQALRDAGQALRAHTMRYLDAYLLQFEENCRRAGGHVHWAANAEEARAIVVGLAQQAIAQGQPSPAIAGHPAGEVPGTHPGIGEASHTPMRGESSRSSR